APAHVAAGRASSRRSAAVERVVAPSLGVGVVKVAVVGAGRVGTAVAVLLTRAGHQVAAVSGRGATTERAATWLPGVPVLPLGATPFRLRDDLRPLYHAAAVFASNYLVATTAVAGRLFAVAGVPDPAEAMRPLQVATLDNVERLGTWGALTGPAARGDVTTIARNLEALAEHAPD